MNRYLRNLKGFTPLERKPCYLWWSGKTNKFGRSLKRRSNFLTGFTLVEMMIGAAILVFALCGLIIGFISLMLLAKIGRDKTVAINDAQQVMEQIWDTTFSKITRVDWENWAANNGCNTLDDEKVKVAYPAGESADPLEIIVTLTWKTKDRPLSVSLVTLRTQG